MNPKFSLSVGLALLMSCASSNKGGVREVATNQEKTLVAAKLRQTQERKAEDDWKTLLKALKSNETLVQSEELKHNLSSILKQNPGHLGARLNRGRLLKYLGDEFGWRQDFKALARQHPDFYPGVNGAIEAWEDEGKIFEAIALLQQFLLRNPMHIQAQYRMAMLHWLHGDWQSSIEQARKVIQLGSLKTSDSIQMDAHILVFRSQLKLGRRDFARLVLKRIGDLWPGVKVLPSLRAEMETALGNQSQALEHLEEAVREEPLRLVLQLKLINGLLESGDFEKALPYLLNLEPVDVHHKSVLRVLFHVYQRSGDFRSAARVSRRILHRLPEDPETLWDYAQLLQLDLKNLPLAIGYYQKLVEVDADWPGARDALEKTVKAHQIAQADASARRQRAELMTRVLEECASMASGQKFDAEGLGAARALKEMAWQIVEEVQAERGAGEEGAIEKTECAFKIMSSVGDAQGNECASMVSIWANFLLEEGQWEEALQALRRAEKCGRTEDGIPKSIWNADLEALEDKLKQLLGPDAAKVLRERQKTRSKRSDL